MTNVSATSAPAAASNGVFGTKDGQFDMFLKLLTTQMQNQDPLDPMDMGEYTQQLAQYSQIEQSIQQTGLLKDLLARMSSSDLAEASGLIGRAVEFDSSVAGLSAAPARWSWTLPRGATTMAAEIVDSSGKLVTSLAVDPGESSGHVSWDGMLADGSRAPDGAYVLKLTAKDASGATLPATIRSLGTVADVTSRDGELWLGIGGVSLPLSELARVVAAPQPTA